ncbi:histone acetyltransferase [Nowakowskiella sp. JEL0078]|nr:histone acetyltransferase [Nowakowskiella sp. JEL0078]
MDMTETVQNKKRRVSISSSSPTNEKTPPTHKFNFLDSEDTPLSLLKGDSHFRSVVNRDVKPEVEVKSETAPIEMQYIAVTEPPKRKDKVVLQEERDGVIKFEVVRNDGNKRNLILLTGLQNIIQKQLPNMPKEYIARLVYDRNHESMAVVKDDYAVMGGITYRLFLNRRFAEIVFCAIASTAQVKGYGARLMSWVKDHIILQLGFSTEISLDKSVWVGYIKDYEGGTMMECVTVPKVKYLTVSETIQIQRRNIFEKINQLSQLNFIIHPGIKFPVGVSQIDPISMPGIKEAGWSPEMNKSIEDKHEPKSHLYNPLSKFVEELKIHSQSWPFLEPVSGVPDYYEVIKDPMGNLGTLSNLVAADKYHRLDDFVTDVRKIFNNCRVYNEDGTPYFKCATKLEKFFNERLKSLIEEYGLSFGPSDVPTDEMSVETPTVVMPIHGMKGGKLGISQLGVSNVTVAGKMGPVGIL